MLHQTQVPRVAARVRRLPRRVPHARGDGRRGARCGDRARGATSATRVGRGGCGRPRSSSPTDGWPDDLADLPGVGRYTAGAIAAQADDVDVLAVEVNIRRVLERVVGERLTTAGAERAMVEVGTSAARSRPPARAHGRRRDAVPPARPVVRRVPARAACASRAACSPTRRASRQAPFAGSFRQRRGRVLAPVARRPGAAPPSSMPKRSRRWSPTASPWSTDGYATLP